MIQELRFALLIHLAVITKLRTCFCSSYYGDYCLCSHSSCIGWSWNSHSNTIVWKTGHGAMIVEGDEFGGVVLDEVEVGVSQRFMAGCNHTNGNKEIGGNLRRHFSGPISYSG